MPPRVACEREAGRCGGAAPRAPRRRSTGCRRGARSPRRCARARRRGRPSWRRRAPRNATPAPMARSSSLAGVAVVEEVLARPSGRSPTASVEVSASSLRNAVQVLLRPTSTASRLGAKSLSDAAPVRNATVTDGVSSAPASAQAAATMMSASTPSRSVGPLDGEGVVGVVEVERGVGGGDAGEAGRGDREHDGRAASGRVLQGGLRVVVRHLVDGDVVRRRVVPMTWTDHGSAAWVLPTAPSSRKPTAHSSRPTHPTGCCRTRDLTNARLCCTDAPHPVRGPLHGTCEGYAWNTPVPIAHAGRGLVTSTPGSSRSGDRARPCVAGEAGAVRLRTRCRVPLTTSTTPRPRRWSPRPSTRWPRTCARSATRARCTRRAATPGGSSRSPARPSRRR